MSFRQVLAGFVVAIGSAVVASGEVDAAEILCQSTARNHMLIDSSYVDACLASGVGNLTGNESNDLFLTGVGGAYDLASKSDSSNPFQITYTQSGNSGTFTFDSSVWDSFSSVAIGFKFGTGNRPDEWFVFSLDSLISTGAWEFINVFSRGGGLSHVNLYGIPGGNSVPEPSVLALFGLSLTCAYFVRRRRRD